MQAGVESLLTLAGPSGELARCTCKLPVEPCAPPAASRLPHLTTLPPTLPSYLQSIPISKLGHLAELDADTLKQQLGLLRQSTQVHGGAGSRGMVGHAPTSMHCCMTAP